LAQSVLLGKTKGWKKHPQLIRFKNYNESISALGFYLLKIHEESCLREYKYSRSKIVNPDIDVDPIKITSGQLIYELNILLDRLKKRSPEKHVEILKLVKRNHPDPHPLFVIIDGKVELWEKSYWTKNIL